MHNLPWEEDKMQEKAINMALSMLAMKWLPPGRGLQMMGSDYIYKRGSMALYNPLHINTKIFTKEYGLVSLHQIEGEKVKVLSRTQSNLKGIGWLDAQISEIQKQPCYAIEFCSPMGNTYRVISSENHRWFTKRRIKNAWERISTVDLQEGYYLPRTTPPLEFRELCPIGVLHGFFFGDGIRHTDYLNQFTDDNKEVFYKYAPTSFIHSGPSHESELQGIYTYNLPLAWKKIPDGEYLKDRKYLLSFLAGYFAADGHGYAIDSSRLGELKEVQSLFTLLGIETSLKENISQSSNFSESRELHKLKIYSGDVPDIFFIKESHKQFLGKKRVYSLDRVHKITKIEKLPGLHPVMCATVPQAENFAIEGFCTTSNCAFSEVNDLEEDIPWIADALMCGCGVGASLSDKPQELYPLSKEIGTYVIPDSREGWVESIRIILHSYLVGGTRWDFDYSDIRPYGSPVKGIGGTASGPNPLIELHGRIKKSCESYIRKKVSWVRLCADIVNAVGLCVVVGNIRRSAEILLGPPSDEEFLDLKNYKKNPDRLSLGWMSNNSVRLYTRNDFLKLEGISERIKKNGEPGILNMVNIQKFGRYGDETYGVDLSTGINPCVPYDTEILTYFGYQFIGDLVGKEITVWNGKEWSSVIPFSTGINPLCKVTFDDGTFLTCTPYHQFILSKNKRKSAEDLYPGDKLEKFSMPVVTSGQNYPIDAYSQGFYSGDGNKGRAKSPLYSTKYMCEERLVGNVGKELSTKEKKYWYHGPMYYDKGFVPINGNLNYCVNWLAGLCDADGIVCRNPNSVSLQISSINKEFLYTIRLMLTRLGIQARVTLSRNEMEKEPPGGIYNTQKCYRLLINSTDVLHLFNLGFKTERLDISIENQNPQRDARRFVQVISVEDLEREEETFCFTESINHTGTFAGIVTGNCGEIPLENKELCNLSEVFPTRCSSRKEFLSAVSDATFYSSTVSLYPTHSPLTNAVIARNRRIGVSLSGIAEWIDTWGAPRITRWIKDGYHLVRETNRIVNEEAGIPPSIRVTAIKPSGSISQVAGVPSGMHYPQFSYAIRRIIVDGGSTLAFALKSSGYSWEPVVEFLKPEDANNREEFFKYNSFAKGGMKAYKSPTSVIFECPISLGTARPAKEVSAWEQFTLLAMLQREWSDNSVSATIMVDLEKEGHQISHMLSAFVPIIKSVSVLPHSDQGIYPQMPYESINREEYEKRILTITEPNWDIVRDIQTDLTGEMYCSNDKCVVNLV